MSGAPRKRRRGARGARRQLGPNCQSHLLQFSRALLAVRMPMGDSSYSGPIAAERSITCGSLPAALGTRDGAASAVLPAASILILWWAIQMMADYKSLAWPDPRRATFGPT